MARPRSFEIVDPVEPEQQILLSRACRAGFERQSLIEQASIRPVPEHGPGDELVHQRLGERTRVIAFAQESDRLVGPPPRLVRIDDKLLKERQQDLNAQLEIVTGL